MMVLFAKPVDQAIVLNPDKADILRKAERIRKTYVWDDRFKK